MKQISNRFEIPKGNFCSCIIVHTELLLQKRTTKNLPVSSKYMKNFQAKCHKNGPIFQHLLPCYLPILSSQPFANFIIDMNAFYLALTVHLWSVQSLLTCYPDSYNLYGTEFTVKQSKLHVPHQTCPSFKVCNNSFIQQTETTISRGLSVHWAHGLHHCTHKARTKLVNPIMHHYHFAFITSKAFSPRKYIF